MLVDIACNISSTQFKDVDDIISRSRKASTIPIFVGVDYESSKTCLELAQTYSTLSFVGLHPTYSQDLHNLHKLFDLHNLHNQHIAAIGECGLDYLRTEFASASLQKKAFEAQLDWKGSHYFLHCRDSHRDFMEMISDYSFSGVVHSFTGSIEESQELIRRGLWIGINGCSLKDEDGIEMVKSLPVERLLIETDSPYCKVRKSYAGYKYISPRVENKILRKRNEPSCLDQILEAVSNIKEIDNLEEEIYKNSINFFGTKLEKIINKFMQN
ncbi:putative deoxyribonuclease TATDN1 like protein [Nosema granulosis]|uniref:Deoxyribonuclease TATDN1 like protein n=1 Tax=Nosema granulosis TaxID=83296 RepID=A0A9P6H0D3_9MICR|nr:putative deoxyribonuclease TATDN1 like protein [Nosema granulosis]